MSYKIAGIDVHKRMLHVVVSDVQVDEEYDFTRRVFGSLPEALRSLGEQSCRLGDRRSRFPGYHQ